MPYISASIVIQLMTLAVPYFQRLQKEGESGRKKINQIFWRRMTSTDVCPNAQRYYYFLQLPGTFPTLHFGF